MRFITLFTCAFLLAFSTGFAKERDLEKKIYIPREFICVREDMLFLACDGELLPLFDLEFDENSPYILEESLDALKSKAWGAWYCPICGLKNPPWASICEQEESH